MQVTLQVRIAPWFKVALPALRLLDRLHAPGRVRFAGWLAWRAVSVEIEEVPHGA